MELPKGEKTKTTAGQIQTQKWWVDAPATAFQLSHSSCTHLNPFYKLIPQVFSIRSLPLSLSTQPTSGSLTQNGSSHFSPSFLLLVAQRVNGIARFKPTQVTFHQPSEQHPPSNHLHSTNLSTSQRSSTRNGRSFTKWKISLLSSPLSLSLCVLWREKRKGDLQQYEIYSAWNSDRCFVRVVLVCRLAFMCRSGDGWASNVSEFGTVLKVKTFSCDQ